jgi:hypothetical protein
VRKAGLVGQPSQNRRAGCATGRVRCSCRRVYFPIIPLPGPFLESEPVAHPEMDSEQERHKGDDELVAQAGPGPVPTPSQRNRQRRSWRISGGASSVAPPRRRRSALMYNSVHSAALHIRTPGDYAARLRSVAATSWADRTGTSSFASLHVPSQVIWPSTTISCIFQTGSHTPSFS